MGVGPARRRPASVEGVEVCPKVRSYLWVLVAGVWTLQEKKLPLKWTPLPRGGMGSEGAVSPVYQGVAGRWLMGALRSVVVSEPACRLEAYDQRLGTAVPDVIFRI